MGKGGFRRINNETFKALMTTDLSGSEFRIILAVIHETVGFRRDRAKIPLSRFQWHTKLSEKTIRRGLREVESRQIITKERDSTRAAAYGLNDYRVWETRVKNVPNLAEQLGPAMTPDYGQECPQTRDIGTNKHRDVKETSKETFRETFKENIPHLPTSSKKTKSPPPCSSSLEDDLPASPPVKRNQSTVAPRTLDYTRGAEPAIGELAREAGVEMNEVADVLWYLEEPASIADIAEAQTFSDSAMAARILKVLKKHGWVKQDGDTWQCVKTIRGAA